MDTITITLALSMLLASLDNIQKQVAEVLVEPPKGTSTKVVVRVDTQQKEFDIAGVDSLWTLAWRWGPVVAFV